MLAYAKDGLEVRVHAPADWQGQYMILPEPASVHRGAGDGFSCREPVRGASLAELLGHGAGKETVGHSEFHKFKEANKWMLATKPAVELV